MRLRRNSGVISGALALCLCCMGVLPACDSSEPESPFKRYLNQLDLALQIPSTAVRFTGTPVPPGPGELQVDIAASSIDSLDLLQVSGCSVQANIGRRATSLGRFAKPSQRLLLELEYLRQAPACIRHLREGNQLTLAASLEAAHRKTQSQLPALIFNATLGSEEYRTLWLATPAAGSYPRRDADTVTAALEAINGNVQRWLSGDYRAHNLNLELLLSEIAGGDVGSRLQTWTHRVDWLASAGQRVAQALHTGTGCGNYQAGALAASRIAIANAYFIDVIQPLMAHSQRQYLNLTRPISALETQLRIALPASYRHWITQRTGYVAALSGAGGQHREQLSRILQSCAVEPVPTPEKASRAHTPEIGYTGGRDGTPGLYL